MQAGDRACEVLRTLSVTVSILREAQRTLYSGLSMRGEVHLPL